MRLKRAEPAPPVHPLTRAPVRTPRLNCTNAYRWIPGSRRLTVIGRLAQDTGTTQTGCSLFVLRRETVPSSSTTFFAPAWRTRCQIPTTESESVGDSVRAEGASTVRVTLAQ